LSTCRIFVSGFDDASMRKILLCLASGGARRLPSWTHYYTQVSMVHVSSLPTAASVLVPAPAAPASDFAVSTSIASSSSSSSSSSASSSAVLGGVPLPYVGLASVVVTHLPTNAAPWPSALTPSVAAPTPAGATLTHWIVPDAAHVSQVLYLVTVSNPLYRRDALGPIASER
jgi:hypothetical protein